MAKQITKGIPGAFTTGETVEWYENRPDYLPADSWVLSVDLVAPDGKQTVTATDNGDGQHLVTISAAETLAYAEGVWRYQIKVTDGTKTHILQSGTLQVCKGFADQSSGYDGRSHAEKVLDAIQAILEGKASSDQSSLSVEGRSLARYTWDELLEARARYRNEYRQERNAERARLGLPQDTHKQVRFI
jgi:hypothetical protein